MTHLSISLFGSFNVTLSGIPINSFRYDKVRALLAYLAVESGRAHRRDALVGMFWPELPQEAARMNLRQALAALRAALNDRDTDPPFLTITRESIRWNPDADSRVDISDFRNLLETCSRHPHRNPYQCKPCEQQLVQAVELYRKDFLDQFFLPDCAAFEEWATMTREGLQRQVLEALTQLISHLERRGEYPQAEGYTRRQLELAPWREDYHRQLMRFLILNDQRSSALAQYEQCCQILARELDSQPEPETTALYEQIRAQGQGASIEPALLRPPTGRPHNLPPQITPFIGRESELAQLSALLSDPACRLVTILGIGGIGKTRLAIQAAIEQLYSFEHGVYFVPLAALDRAEDIVPAMIAALQIPITGEAPPYAQLLDYLKDRNILLVLDNFEHLQADASLVAEILKTAPETVVLVTSRERLNLQGEWLFEIQGLNCPRADQVQQIENFDATELFLRSARRLQPDFRLATAEKPALVHICRMLDGMPLAIEIASAWTRMLSLQEIAAEIDADLRFLSNPLQDLPPRHHSLQAVFDSSWELLDPEEQKVMRRLAIFPGSFERSAAEWIAGASLSLLKSLVDKSLLHRKASGRYEMHDLIRQYSFQQLQAAGEVALVQDRRLACYLDLSERGKNQINGEQGAAWLRRLEEERDNLNAALGWAMEAGKIELGLSLAANLYRFWYWHTHFREGLHWLETFLSASEALDPPVSSYHRAEALFAAGVMADKQKKQDRALVFLKESQALWNSLGEPGKQAMALNSMGAIAIEQKDLDGAWKLIEASLVIRREIGQEAGLPTPLTNLGIIALERGEYDQAEELFEESLAIDRKMHNQAEVAVGLSHLALIQQMRGSYTRARALYQDSLRMLQEFADLEGIADCLEGLAVSLIGLSPTPDHALHTARLLGAAEVQRENIQVPLREVESARLVASMATAKEQLGESAFLQAWSEGRAMSLQNVLDYVQENI